MTTIGTSLVITGELASDEDVTLNGQIRGPVSMRGATLIVGEQARVEGDVRGTRVVIRGRLDGSVTATERIELEPTAAVAGSLSANQVVIADHATFNGGIDMGQRTIAAKMAQYKSKSG